MLTLTEFLLARIAEDEETAKAHPFEREWSAHPDETGQPIRAGKARIATCAESVMAHIARHDPARVLAECEAKRRIVELHNPCDDWSYGDPTTCPELVALALPFADHPDYRAEEWAP